MKDEKNNSGDRNSGYLNSGNRNSGNWNSGDWNSGNWNKCNYETGFFNSMQSDTIKVFNKDCKRIDWENTKKPNFIYFSRAEWVNSNEMTNEEKENHPTHETTGGYLKEYEYQEAFKLSYEKASKEDKELIFKLPNFDADVFFEISGIDLRKKDNSEAIAKIELQMAELQKQIDNLKN